MRDDAYETHDGDPRGRPRIGGALRPRPIRYDLDTWLVMRKDPVLPEAIITRVRAPKKQEFFLVIHWDLDPEKRYMTGRYPTLQDADAAVRYRAVDSVIIRPGESLESVRKREEDHARELARQQAERTNLYSP